MAILASLKYMPLHSSEEEEEESIALLGNASDTSITDDEEIKLHFKERHHHEVDPHIKFHDYDVRRHLSFYDPLQIRIAPNQQIYVEITNSEHLASAAHLNPYLHTVELRYGSYRWTVKKRYNEFLTLHSQLIMFNASLALHRTMIRYKQFRQRFKTDKVPNVPKFPHVPDFFIKRADLPQRKADLEQFLREVLEIDGYRAYHYTLEFLEISPLSFVQDLGCKYKEGYVLKRSDGYSTAVCGNVCKRWCLNLECCHRWQYRWFVVKDSFVSYLNPSNGQVRCVLLFDHALKVVVGEEATGHPEGLAISNYFRNLRLKCGSEREANEWAEELREIINTRGTEYTKRNKNGSFAPERLNSNCKWIVDGATYFEAVAVALEKAQEEIFITGWWLTPEFYMKRPTVHGHYWQLSYILKRKAHQGVKIYILIYKEVELALGLNSAYTKEFFSRLHEKNIKVLRHPRGAFSLWAHHEKIVCIDQTYAFVGGLDICYGRWDDFQHRLTDLGEVEEKIRVLRHLSTMPVIPSLKKSASAPDLTSFESSTKCNEICAPLSEKKMSVDDQVITTEKTTQEGSPKLKIIAHKLIALSRLRKFIDQDLTDSSNSEFANLPTKADINRTIQHICIVHLGMEKKFRLWHGKDYTNFISKDITELEKAYSDTIDRNVTPRMPWHDVGVFVQGSPARDISRHFIERWNFTKTEKKKVKGDNFYPLLLPKVSYVGEISSILSSEIGTLFSAHCQVLRSVSLWSAGIETTEHSIQNAYVDTIINAQHYIYIENQFFVTQPSGQGDVFNGIADALFKRIMQAHKDGKCFRVYVVMPLLPAFEGEIGTGTGTVILAVSHWNYASMCRGPTSLYERLRKEIPDPSEYLYFYGLRKHGVLNGKLVTELVYVHSKIMIVDDTVAIIGSANINDRSLLGRRDSEIALKIWDCNFVNSYMDGAPYQAGIFCHSLRKTLFREHLGLLFEAKPTINITDPVAESFFKNSWHDIAESNTEIYEEVFCCIPTNKVCSFRDLKQYQCVTPLAVRNVTEASKKLEGIQGHLVIMPFHFLCDENLMPTIAQKEGLLPNSIWT